MGYEKNNPKRKKTEIKAQNKYRPAYTPTPPFRTVEGIESEGYSRLHVRSVWVLMEFYIKFNGFNRSNLSLTYKEVSHKMSTLIFSRSIWQLIGLGFIDVKRLGRLERNCSIFGLSNRWRRLSEHPERLDEIQAILDQIVKLKRAPGNVDKRMEMERLRKEALRLGRG